MVRRKSNQDDSTKVAAFATATGVLAGAATIVAAPVGAIILAAGVIGLVGKEISIDIARTRKLILIKQRKARILRARLKEKLVKMTR